MEKRKIQKTGSSSYIVTLPKEWVDLVGLKPGDYVNIHQFQDKLIITSAMSDFKRLYGEIIVNSPIDNNQVFRILVGMYLSGYDTIKIQYDPGIPNLAKRINDLKSLARIKLAGVEIIDETFNSLTLKFLIDFKELQLVQAIRRLHILVNNMLRDSLQAFKNKNVELAETVIQRDDECDRFHFMIVRQLSQAFIDVGTMKELGIDNPVEALNYRIIARNLERIADHAVNISRRTLIRGEVCNLCSEIYELGTSIIKLFDKSMDCLYKLDRLTCEEVIRDADSVIKEIEKFLSRIISEDINSNEKIVLTLILDSLRRITRYSSGIAESSLNIKVCKTNAIELK